MKTKLLLILCLAMQAYGFAQKKQLAWVYFKDKKDVEASIKNPISILTQRAIDRKVKHGVKIDERDVPVNEVYISEIKKKTKVLAKSKWMNCVLVEDTQSKVNDLKKIDFVKEIEFASKNLNAKIVVDLAHDKFAIERVEQEQTPQNYKTATDFTYYSRAKKQIEMIKADVLHQKGYTGEGVLVAVIDDGFKDVNSHSTFKRIRDAGKILGTYDFPRRTESVYAVGGHGTMVLSDIAGDVKGQMMGTGPDATFYLFRTEDDRGETPAEEAYWVEASERADSLGVDMTTTSLGYYDYKPREDYTHSKKDMSGKTTFAARGANIGMEKGLLQLVSAGNEGRINPKNPDKWRIVATPGDAIGAFTVGAVNSRRTRAKFSSLGSSDQATQKPDVMAQGAGIIVHNPNSNDPQPSGSQGTSFSTPILCGAVASLWQAAPHLTNKEIMQIVRESSDRYTKPNYEYGYGIPDFSKALTLSNDEFAQQQLQIKLFPNPTTSKITFAFGDNMSGATAEIFNVLGKKVKTFTIARNNQTFDVSDIANGVYLVKVEVGNTSKTMKLIKR